MRLAENGLLRRGEHADAVLALLRMMARTPRGSWPACPGFGLRDLFESGLRANVPRLMAERINETLGDLGIDGYRVSEVVREPGSGRDDTYTVTLEAAGSTEILTAGLAQEF